MYSYIIIILASYKTAGILFIILFVTKLIKFLPSMAMAMHYGESTDINLGYLHLLSWIH